MTITQGYAVISSPGFGVDNYVNDLDCHWDIVDPKNRSLTLSFSDFNTENRFDLVSVSINIRNTEEAAV